MPPPPGGPTRSFRGGNFPRDILLTSLGKREEHFRGGTGDTWEWPTILPMWFQYTNPVSGRMPEFFQGQCVPCTVRPDLRLEVNGAIRSLRTRRKRTRLSEGAPRGGSSSCSHCYFIRNGSQNSRS